MSGKRFDRDSGVTALRRRLEPEPFVEDQSVVLEAIVEGVERGGALRSVQRGEDRERALPIGHIIGGVILRLGQCRAARRVGGGDQPERNRAQAAQTLGGGTEVVAGQSDGFQCGR